MSDRYYVFGNVICRGITGDYMRTSFTIEEAEQFLELVYASKVDPDNDQHNEAIDDFLDAFDNFDKASAISLLMFEANTVDQCITMLEKIQTGQSFYLAGEEQLYGYSLDKEQVKLQFVEGGIFYGERSRDNGNDEDWDEE